MQVDPITSLGIEERLVDAHERVHAELANLLDLILEFDRRDAYLVDGACDVVDWVCYRFGYAEQTAREYHRIAKALQFLPAIDERWRRGLLTYDKVRWLTEFCTPDEDAGWADDAIGMDAAQVRMIALHRRRHARELSDARRRRRYLRMVADPESGSVRLWARLPEADGMLVKKALDRVADQQPRDALSGALLPLEQRRADALVELASLQLGADADPDRATIVCHVDAVVLSSDDGTATIDGEMSVGVEVVRRLMCDSRLQTVVHDQSGEPIGIGTVSRLVPHSLRRLLMHRDRACVWDGCSNKRWLHAHHVIHVAHGGRTDEDNLVMICGAHHRLVHEGGWKIRGRPGRDLRIVRPDGSVLGRPALARAP